jgi:hypothetical protein
MVYKERSKTPRQRPRSASSSGSAMPSAGRSYAHHHPVWDQINTGEIDARIEVLYFQLQSARAQFFRERVRDLHCHVPPEFRAHPGIGTQQHLIRRATLDADLYFLRRFLRGVCEVFAEHLDRMQLGLGPRDLGEIWASGIEPRWTRQVRLVTARWRRQVNLNESMRAACVSEVENGAARIHDYELRAWRVRIEQANPREGQTETRKTLPVPIRNGERCVRLSEEMRRIKHMCLEGGRTMAEIRREHPDFQIWTIRERLGTDDQDVFDHPRRWGAGYDKSALSKEYSKSKATIKDWMKAYRKHCRACDGAKR